MTPVGGTGPDPTGYRAALDELEEILATIEGDEIDIDALSGHVERAAVLIRFCRGRIDNARMEVERVVAEVNRTPDATTGEE